MLHLSSAPLKSSDNRMKVTENKPSGHRYCIIMYEHTMHIMDVLIFIWGTQNLPQKCFKTGNKMTFSPNTWTYVKLNIILMWFLNKMLL